MWQNKFIKRFDKNNGSWQISLQLENSLNNWVNSVDKPNEADFADFCFEQSNLLNLDNIYTQHLCAYLENIGWYTSQSIHYKIIRKGEDLRSNIIHTSVEDIFQIFWEKEANNPIVFYKNYNPTLGTLVKYTKRKMKCIIEDDVFDNPVDTHTGYGLLKKLNSEIKKKEALQRQGYNKKTDVMFDNYITIWKLFNEVCRHHKKEPKPEHWQTLTQLYNKDNQPTVEEEVIQGWINNICISAAKNYLSIRIQQPNSPEQDIIEQLRGDNNTPEYILEQEHFNHLTNHLTNNFYAQSRTNFQDFINNNLTLEEQQVMFLLYGLNFNQTEVAEQLGWYSTKNDKPEQFKVSRCKTKIFKKLIKSYIDVIKTNQNQLEWLNLDAQVKLNSEIINLAKNYFEPILEKYNSESMNLLVEQALNQSSNQNECVLLKQRKSQLKTQITNRIYQELRVCFLDSYILLSKINELIRDYYD
ncbi:hypothetical protein [Okeania sp. SIO2B3]|uniref:hypothetical protein n=1 Tax=Okeania sp. SIO2B3 TaxID=2607784 RepID=UPI0013BFF856|nr:hypothetical protein [Okeania sp. SIO2B3]NET45432.1 hypothetical protein [Okeania sp. SIO2B3]